MKEKIIKIKLSDVEDLIKNVNEKDRDLTYILELENCNGITTELLNYLEALALDIKFKINGDLFNSNNIEENTNTDNYFKDNFLYNYNIDQMKKIIAYFEEVVRAMPKMSEIGRFLFIYTVICFEIDYDKSKGFDFKNYFELSSLQRSLYGTLINGEGVCVGYSLTLYNLLSYVNVNCKELSGEAYLPNGNSGGHVWNAVQIDGKWYFVDATWDSHHFEKLENCLVVNNNFMTSHVLNTSSNDKIINCVFASQDYNHNTLKQMYTYILEEFFIKPNLTEKLRAHRIEKKELYTFDKYKKEMLEGNWQDFLSKFDIDFEKHGTSKK